MEVFSIQRFKFCFKQSPLRDKTVTAGCTRETHSLFIFNTQSQENLLLLLYDLIYASYNHTMFERQSYDHIHVTT